MDIFVLLVILGGASLVGLTVVLGVRSIMRKHRYARRRRLELAPLVQRLGWELRELDAEADQEEIAAMLQGTSLHALVTEGGAALELLATGALDGHQAHLFDLSVAQGGSLQTPALAALMLLAPDRWTAIVVRSPRRLPRFYLQPQALAHAVSDLVGPHAAEFVKASGSSSPVVAGGELDAHRSDLGRLQDLREHPVIAASARTGAGAHLFVECTGDRLLVHDVKRPLPAADLERRLREVISLASWLAERGAVL